MRLIATVAGDATTKRLMLCTSDEGCHIFLYDSAEDSASFSDYLVPSLEEAREFCCERFFVGADDWEEIADIQPGCQQDWIAPVRVKGREMGSPQWGCYERLIDGLWIDVP